MELGTDYTLTCTVELVKPKASIYWRIDGELDTSHNTEITDLADGAHSLKSEKMVTFSDYDQETAQVDCVVTVMDDSGTVIDDTEKRTFQLYCELHLFTIKSKYICTFN